MCLLKDKLYTYEIQNYKMLLQDGNLQNFAYYLELFYINIPLFVLFLLKNTLICNL